MFEAPQYAVRGARKYDQDWIDGNVEAGVGACGWKRPKPRPAEWSGAVPSPRRATVKKKPGLVQRIKDKVTWPKAAAPLEIQMPPVPEVAQPEPLAAPPPVPPRDPVDELLDPVSRR